MISGALAAGYLVAAAVGLPTSPGTDEPTKPSDGFVSKSTPRVPSTVGMFVGKVVKAPTANNSSITLSVADTVAVPGRPRRVHVPTGNGHHQTIMVPTVKGKIVHQNVTLDLSSWLKVKVLGSGKEATLSDVHGGGTVLVKVAREKTTGPDGKSTYRYTAKEIGLPNTPAALATGSGK